MFGRLCVLVDFRLATFWTVVSLLGCNCFTEGSFICVLLRYGWLLYSLLQLWSQGHAELIAPLPEFFFPFLIYWKGSWRFVFMSSLNIWQKFASEAIWSWTFLWEEFLMPQSISLVSISSGVVFIVVVFLRTFLFLTRLSQFFECGFVLFSFTVPFYSQKGW